jgi:two-component system, LytTR family, response regulator
MGEMMATQTLIAADPIVSGHYGDGIRSEEMRSVQYVGRIVFKSRGRTLFLPVSHICWIGAEENYVRICTGNESHLLRETMTSIEQRLDPRQFLRVHRSAIVNLRYVKELRSKSRGECMVHLVNGQKLPMSRSYRARIGEVLNRCGLRALKEPSESSN